MCGLAGFWQIWGLDMRFLGGKWRKKNGPMAMAIESVLSPSGDAANADSA
jgi:hypothetical protein